MANDDKIVKMLEVHFEDDNKRFDRVTQLLEQYGPHMSFFNKNLEEVKTLLIDQNKTTSIQYKEFVDHRSRIEPMIKNYEQNVAFSAGLKSRRNKVLGTAGSIITLAGAWYIIKEFLITVFR